MTPAKEGGKDAIDILQLVDRLEELVERGRRWPLGNSVLIDREAFLNLIDQMRISVPQELKRSQELEAERERYVARAQEDARRILEQAREDAARLLDAQEIRQQAELDARRILERARREAAEIRGGADAYAEQVLRDLDRQVRQIARVIQNGLRELAGERAQADDLARKEAAPSPGAETDAPGAHPTVATDESRDEAGSTA